MVFTEKTWQYCSVQHIFHEELLYRKVSCRWILHLLSETHKKEQIDAAQDFLILYNEAWLPLLDQIVTGDEMWVHHLTQNKAAICTLDSSWSKEKNKTEVFDLKKNCNSFWNNQGILRIPYLPRNQTINSVYYCHYLRDSRDAICQKWKDKSSSWQGTATFGNSDASFIREPLHSGEWM